MFCMEKDPIYLGKESRTGIVLFLDYSKFRLIFKQFSALFEVVLCFLISQKSEVFGNNGEIANNVLKKLKPERLFDVSG